MKQKVFIIFMLISLISLLLIACGQNGKEPDDNAEAQRKSEEEKERLRLLEREKLQRIADIKKN
ncbi:putative membrane spanning protein [Borrelia duttonii CR2A]|uniref:Putative membrane spanning protein n=1 Tax=Borrelia duttonii CR2A TaxID=1432657 RepID=W6TKR1_9SPIR|nr:hypothetical protein [Borrelia duttonii]ETZ17889.1 putative membrane spanning protein [Borrelia duttonii CR2A]